MPSERRATPAAGRGHAPPCQVLLAAAIAFALAATIALALAACAPAPERAIPDGEADARSAERPAPEVLLYTGGSGERALESFRAHAAQIDIVAPQAFGVDSAGRVFGEVSPELLAVAREHGVEVVPLVHNPGFNQEVIHALLNDPSARAQTVADLVRLAEEGGFDGWQFDFENIHVSDRDLLTQLYRETAAALRPRGRSLSIAVVPTDGSDGETPFQRYMQANWRGSFDVAALAEIGDFVSLMTYAQHGGVTTPGPIAGLPWMRRMLDYALAEGVPPEKLSLGIPSYSGYWRSGYDEERGARVEGREIGYQRALELLETSGAEAEWLPELGVSRASWQQEVAFEWLFLEDARALEAKLDLFDSYPGLRGVSVWVLGAEGPEWWEVLERRLRR